MSKNKTKTEKNDNHSHMLQFLGFGFLISTNNNNNKKKIGELLYLKKNSPNIDGPSIGPIHTQMNSNKKTNKTTTQEYINNKYTSSFTS